MPGRGGGAGGRTGCDGSGRGPPIGPGAAAARRRAAAAAAADGPDAAGGRAGPVPGRPAGSDCRSAACGVCGRWTGGRTSIGRRGGAGGAWPVRGSSTRSRSVGGTTRPVGGGITGARRRRVAARPLAARAARAIAGSSDDGRQAAQRRPAVLDDRLDCRCLDDGRRFVDGQRRWRRRQVGSGSTARLARAPVGDRRRLGRRLGGRRWHQMLGLARRGGGSARRARRRRRRRLARLHQPRRRQRGRRPASAARAPCRPASAP